MYVDQESNHDTTWMGEVLKCDRESRHIRASVQSPLEWNFSPSLVAAVFNALYG